MAKGMHIRKDDTVLVIAGKDKGKTGKVLRTEPGKPARLRRGPQHRQARHQRPRSIKDTQKAQSSGIIDQEGPIDVSNVMLLDPSDNKPTRVGMRVTDAGERERYAKRTGKTIE